MDLIEPRSRRFWRTSLALFAAGFATFALLYAVQPLMPVFSGVFGVSPAVSSLSLSVTTMLLAVAMLLASGLADRHGRKGVMVASLVASGVLGVGCAVAPGFWALLVVRGAMGVSLAGLPSVSMTYVAEEMAPAATGLAMGLFIGGSAIGGMSGRLLAGFLTAHFGWRAALAVVGAAGLGCGAVLARFLPAGRAARRSGMGVRALWGAFLRHGRDRVLRRLFAEAFLLMGGFVTIYNYVAFRLLGPPFGLGQDQVSLIFAVYLFGVVTSAVMGEAALRVGRRAVFLGNVLVMLGGVGLTLAAGLWWVVAGVAAVTAGFFGAHSVASAWVGAAARDDRAQASALYLLAYYAGSSVVGTVSGFLWAGMGWTGVAGLVGGMLVAAVGLGVGLPGR